MASRLRAALLLGRTPYSGARIEMGALREAGERSRRHLHNGRNDHRPQERLRRASGKEGPRPDARILRGGKPGDTILLSGFFGLSNPEI